MMLLFIDGEHVRTLMQKGNEAEEQGCRHANERGFLHSVKREGGCTCQVHKCNITMVRVDEMRPFNILYMDVTLKCSSSFLFKTLFSFL